jgi:ubiquinone/menaquinone biosynthesis C-methylase UbiE
MQMEQLPCGWQNMPDKINWEKERHESKVEKFYGSGIDGFHDYHSGYLNFGLWTLDFKTNAQLTYEQAAENMVAHMAKLLGLNSQSKLLDIGSGMGTQDVFIFKKFNPISIDGLDVTWKHVLRSAERAKRNGIPLARVQFHHGTAVELPFGQNLFTHVLSIEAPEHFDTREVFFKEAFRVLKPGGVLAICDYSLARQPKNIFEKLIAEFARSIWEVPKTNIYGNSVFEEKLKLAGFKNVQIQNVGKWTIPGYYFEHRKLESIKEVWKVRGFLKGVVGGFLVDIGVYWAFKIGILEYILLRAEKSMQQKSVA